MPLFARARRAVGDWFSAETHPANLAVVRIVVFGILLDRLLAGGFRRFVRLPEALRVLPPGIEPVLRVFPLDERSLGLAQVAAAAFAALALAGLYTRASSALATLLGCYVLGVPYLFGKVDHTLNHVIWFGALLAASPSGDALSIDAWRARRRGAPPPGPARAYALPIRLMWLLMGVAYFFPGLYKLLAGPQWVLGDNLRFTMYESWRHHHALPALRVDRLPLLVRAGALGTIAFELSFVFLVLSRRTRPLAAVGGLLFHASTAYFMHIYFFELMACYVVFVDWHALAQRLGLARAAPAADASSAARAAPSANATAVIGGLLLAANLAFGVGSVRSWPFSVYPRFSDLRTRPETLEIEAWIESEAGSRPAPLPLRGALLKRSLRQPGDAARVRRLRALAELVLSGRPPLAPGERLRIYAVTYSTLPERWQEPPLRRRLLFDYDAAQHVEPGAQP